MRVYAGIDKKTASKWVLRLEISAEEMALAEFSEQDVRLINENMQSGMVSNILLGAWLYAVRVEQGLGLHQDKEEGQAKQDADQRVRTDL